MIRSRDIQVCMVIGDPISQSLSPQMHTAAYEQIGCADKFKFIAKKVSTGELEEVVNGARTQNIRGISCTLPHKESVIRLIDNIDPAARSIGAVNTIVNNEGVLTGFNTDIDGIVTPLQAITDLSDKKVLILGAGGAARSAIVGLLPICKSVSLVNRTEVKGRKLTLELGATFLSTVNPDNLSEFDVIVNTTPVGMTPVVEQSPLPGAVFTPRQIVMDAIYNPAITRLLSDARSAGATVVTGIEMFVAQGARQFELYTGKAAPIDTMRETVCKALGVHHE